MLYVLSDYLPGLIVGNVIDATTGTGAVVGAVVPEPATLALLGLGGIAMLKRLRRPGRRRGSLAAVR